MKQSCPASLPEQNKEVLCMSLPFLKSVKHLEDKKEQILKNSSHPDYLPLSAVEECLLRDLKAN
jgi:hypothetical protein